MTKYVQTSEYNILFPDLIKNGIALKGGILPKKALPLRQVVRGSDRLTIDFLTNNVNRSGNKMLYSDV